MKGPGSKTRGGSRKLEERPHRAQAPKDGRSRIHRIIRDRVVGSKWFGRIVMFVIIVNSLLLWPWTDAAKHKDRVESYDAYSLINWLFIIVYLVEFGLKVRPLHHCFITLVSWALLNESGHGMM